MRKREPGVAGRLVASRVSPTVLFGTTVPETLWFFDGLPRALRSAGWDVLLWSSPGEQLTMFAGREGCVAFGIPQPRAICLRADLVAFCHLLTLCVRTRPTVIHANTPKAGLLGTLAGYLSGVPVRIYHVHGFPFLTAKGWRKGLLVAIEQLTALFATRVICVGHGVLTEAIQHSIRSHRIPQIIRYGSANGVDTVNAFNPARFSAEEIVARRAALGLARTDTIVIFVGRLATDKGVRELCEAWTMIAPEFPRAHLLIIGGADARDSAHEMVFKAAEQVKSIHVLGERSDIPGWYSIADLAVLPSYREGVPYAVLEAGAMGVPIVATRVCGCAETVVDGKTGRLIPARDQDALADALRSYLANPALRLRHGAAARQHVMSRYERERVKGDTVAEYRHIAEEYFSEIL